MSEATRPRRGSYQKFFDYWPNGQLDRERIEEVKAKYSLSTKVE